MVIRRLRFFQVREDALGAFSRDDFAEAFNAGAADIGNAAEFTQKTLRRFWTDTGDFQKRGSGLPFAAALAVKRDGETVSLVADLLDEMKNRRVAVEDDGLVFLAVNVKNFFFFGDAGERLIDDLQ